MGSEIRERVITYDGGGFFGGEHGQVRAVYHGTSHSLSESLAAVSLNGDLRLPFFYGRLVKVLDHNIIEFQLLYIPGSF